MFVRTCVCLCAPDRLDGWMIFLLLSFWMACSCLSILQPCLPALLSFYMNYWLTDHLGDSSDWRCRLSVCHFVCSWTKLKWFALVFKPKRKLISAVYIFCDYHLCNDHFFPIATSICCRRVQSVMSGESTQLIIVRLMVIFCFHFEHIRKRMKRVVLSSERHSDTTGSSLVLQSNLPSS